MVDQIARIIFSFGFEFFPVKVRHDNTISMCGIALGKKLGVF